MGRCIVCEKEIIKGEGRILYRKLVHKKCSGILKMLPSRYMNKKLDVRNYLTDNEEEFENE